MNKKLYGLMNWPAIEEIVYSESDNPHATLGPHVVGNSTLVQAFIPGAVKVRLQKVDEDKSYKMEQADEEGFFVVLVSGKNIGDYEYIAEYADGSLSKYQDPYIYEPIIPMEQIKAFDAGINYEIYKYLGAHPMTLNGKEGVLFAVWAPSAVRVSVVGQFNHWDGRINQMRRIYDSGVFELFVPGVKIGDTYKFEIKNKGDICVLKSDPYGFSQELRPNNASVVVEADSFSWSDDKFIKNRNKLQSGEQPISVYEVYLGSFAAKEDGSYMNYKDIAPLLAEYVKKMGYTHVELMPIMEHPLDESWGYQVIGYYAPTSRYGTATDFKAFIDLMHKEGIGVILDWVPAHFPKDENGLGYFDGTFLYEPSDDRRKYHAHWGTYQFDYGKPQVSNYLIGSALYWVEEFHADGIRMDAVASMLYHDYGRMEGDWLPNIYGGNENLEAVEFLKHLNSIMKKRNPGVLMIAEESTAWPRVTGDLKEDGLGFDLKWNMGWMNDYLQYIKNDPYFRAGSHDKLTFSMIYNYSEKFQLVFSHDEVVHGKASMLAKMPGERAAQFANLRLSYAYLIGHPGKKLLFMGQDLGEYDEWNEKRLVQWNLQDVKEHAGIQKLVADLNKIYKKYPALYALDDSYEGFEWINCINPESGTVSFVRKTKNSKDTVLVICNFSGTVQKMRVGVLKEGKYEQILHTDDKKYGGLGDVLTEPLYSKKEECDDREYSIKIQLPALSAVFLKYSSFNEEDLTNLELIHTKEALEDKEDSLKQISDEISEVKARKQAAYEAWLKQNEEAEKQIEKLLGDSDKIKAAIEEDKKKAKVVQAALKKLSSLKKNKK